MERFLSWLKEKFKFNGDKVILIVTLFLTVVSLYAVYSSTGTIKSHLFHFVISFVLIFIFYRINYRFLSAVANIFLVLGGILLILTLLSGDHDNRGLSLLGIEFQTFYLIGFLVILFLSKYIGSKLNNNEQLTPQNSLVLIGIVLIFCGGIAMTNMSTAIILFLTSLVVLFIGNLRYRYILLLISFVLIGGAIFLFTGLGRGETFKGRVNFYITQDNSKGYGDQIILAKAAIARSGFKPAGPGQGVIKNALPEKETDYVFATVFEEIGVVVGFLILFSYLILFTRAWKISRDNEGAFAKLLAIGIGFWVACQGLVHIAVNVELLPATGQTLPFISRGGSSLIISGIMIGVLLNLSKYAKQSKSSPF